MAGEIELLPEMMLDYVIGHDASGKAGRRRARLITPRALRAPNSIVYIGDSRNASKFLDPIKYNKSSAGWANWMEAYLRGMGKPLTVLGCLAVSGSRSDEHMAVQLDAAIALAPAFIAWQGFVNDIAQQYPTAGTCVATCFSNYKAMVKKVNDAGIAFVHLFERGAGNMSATQIGQLNDLNRMVADFIQWGDGDGRGAPNIIVIDSTPVSMVTSNNGTLAIKAAFTLDQVHDNIPGAKALGYLAANEMAPYLRKLPGHRLRNLSQAKQGLGSRGMLTAAGFPGSVAAAGTGNSGNIPSSMNSGSCTGGVTAVYSVQATAADADGNTWGNEVKIVLTATAAGSFSFYNSLDRTGIVQGAIIRSGLEVDVVAGASGFQGAYANIEWFPTTGGTAPLYDLIPPAAFGNDTTGVTNFVLEPDAFVIPTFTGTPFTNLALRGTFSGPGSATLITRKWWAEVATK